MTQSAPLPIAAEECPRIRHHSQRRIMSTIDGVMIAVVVNRVFERVQPAFPDLAFGLEPFTPASAAHVPRSHRMVRGRLPGHHRRGPPGGSTGF